MKYDLAVVGHIVLDCLRLKGRTQNSRQGGPCIYAGLAAKSLDGQVIVLSKVGRDFGSRRLIHLRKLGISTSHIVVTDSSTTRFRINYREGDRSMCVTSICDPISNEDIQTLPSSSAIHIGPVLNEVPHSLAMRLTECNSEVGLDPQGYLRKLDSNGTVRVRKWRDRSLLKKITVLKVSESELPQVVGTRVSIKKLSKLGSEIVLLTKGAQGTIVWSRDNGMFNVPAHPTHVRNPTGAGDALLGAFLITWVRTGDLLWAAAVGSSIASFVVAQTKLGHFGTRKQIENRALRILDRTTKI
jgi:sugar/nucleoside kinase (ribokinase family)